VGSSSNVGEFVTKMERTVKANGTANREALKRAAQVYKDVGLRELGKDTGGNLRLSRWGSATRRKAGGLKLGIGYEIRGKENAAAYIRPRPAGAWKVLEYGTQPHEIKPRRGRGRRGTMFANSEPGGRSGIGGYSHPVRKVIQHPGARGKNTFTRAARIAEPRAIDVYSAAYARALLAEFR
jgi:hypothetical protein